MERQVDIGVIGGSGVYDAEFLKNSEEITLEGKYGSPADSYLVGEYLGKQIAFLPRHGKDHALAPHQVNYRANIDGFRQLGVQRIIAAQAVGSLKEEYKPGDLAFTDQFIDRTSGRESTFFDEGKVAHVSMADPMCQPLREILISGARELGIKHHEKATYVCIQGPRFSTRAESELFRSWNADIIGMTLVPESILAKEASICYAPVSMVTDYDCWKEGHIVSHEEVISVMEQNVGKIKKLLVEVIAKIPDERSDECKNAMEGATA